MLIQNNLLVIRANGASVVVKSSIECGKIFVTRDIQFNQIWQIHTKGSVVKRETALDRFKRKYQINEVSGSTLSIDSQQPSR